MGNTASDRKNARCFSLKFSRNTDKDLIEHLEQQESIQAYLKNLIRQDMKGARTMTAQEIIENGSYDAAVELIDDEIREELNAELAPCTELEFLEAYMAKHEEKFGQPFRV